MTNVRRVVRRTVLILSVLILLSQFPLALQSQLIEGESALALFAALLNKEELVRTEAAVRLAAMNDRSVIPAFLETLRFKRPDQSWVGAMETLTGQAFGDDWARWMEWYWSQDITPHPEYLEFKSAILQKIDPRFQEFLYPDVEHKIGIDEILWGGVRVDGIPALTNPKFLARSEATYLEDDEPVFGIEVNGDARAYPLRIMDWHEMANDVVGGVPVALAYCTLCGSAILYESTSNGTVYTFGSSGLLYRSNKLMYDHQTKSLWAELYGRPVVGPLVESGIQLNYLPIVRTTWKSWNTAHPRTKVLDKDTGFRRDYSPGAAYGKYFESQETMFPVPVYDRSIAPKDWVYGIIVNGEPKAYLLKALDDRGVLNDSIGGTEVVVLAEAEVLSVRVYERSRFRFEKREGDVIVDSTGGRWMLTESHLERIMEDSKPGSNAPARLARLPGHLAYWFGWYAFFPKTKVYESD